MTTDRWLVLDCYVDDPEGGAGNFLPLLPGPAQSIRVPWHGISGSPSDWRGLVITGSAASVCDGHEWVQSLTAFLRDAVSEGVPTLGVCFGHQVLAEAIGGDGTVRRSPTPELGWFDIHHDGTDPILTGIDKKFRTFLSHFDEVSPDLSGVNVLASSQRCPVQAFRVPNKPLWGVQFHAEMALEEATRLVRKRVGVDPRLPGDPEEVLKDAMDSSSLVKRVVHNFVNATSQGNTNS